MSDRTKRVNNPDVEAEAALQFNSCKRGGYKVVTREELLERLDKMIDEDGYIVPKKDIKTWQLLYRRAKLRKAPMEKVVADAGRVIKGVKKDQPELLTKEDHIRNILDCVNEEGVIENLSKKHPSTYHKVSRLARVHKKRTESIINELMGVEDGTYKYHQKTSVFDFGRLSIFGDDDSVNQKVADAIRDCMQDYNYVINLKKKYRSVFTIIEKLSMLNGITFQEALRIFVPEANYKTQHGRSEFSEKQLYEFIKQFDDGTGCIDLARNNNGVVDRIRYYANKKGLSINQELEELGGFYFSSWPYEVDIYDYIRVRLHGLFSHTMDATGLQSIDRPLYSRIRRLRYQFPGGAMKSIEEMINYFGYDYAGNKAGTKFTYKYVAKLLDGKYHGQKQIHNIYDDKSVGNAIFYYSGMHGLTFKEALESFGYEYEESAGMNMFKKVNLTRSEYLSYLRLKEEMEREGKKEEPKKKHEEKFDADEIVKIDPSELFDDDEPGDD